MLNYTSANPGLSGGLITKPPPAHPNDSAITNLQPFSELEEESVGLPKITFG